MPSPSIASYRTEVTTTTTASARRSFATRNASLLAAGTACAYLIRSAGDGGGGSASFLRSPSASFGGGGGRGKMEMIVDETTGLEYAAAKGTGTGGGEAEDGAATATADPFWIVVTAVDGVGNQMFQYASALGMMLDNAGTKLAKRRQLRLCYHIRPDATHPLMLPQVFLGPFTGPCPDGVAAKTCGKDCLHGHFEEGLATHTPLDLDGRDASGEKYADRPGAFVGRYLQSHRYFEGIEGLLRELFRFRADEYHDAMKEIVREMFASRPKDESNNAAQTQPQTDGVEVVGIQAKSSNLLGYADVPLPPDAYFERAMSFFEERGKKQKKEVAFILLAATKEEEDALMKYESFSSRSNNKVKLARAAYERDAGGGGGRGQDLILMASCDHIITTMGAFGWWAGWLSGGTVVYYKDLYGHVGKGGKNRILPDHHFSHFGPCSVQGTRGPHGGLRRFLDHFIMSTSGRTCDKNQLPGRFSERPLVKSLLYPSGLSSSKSWQFRAGFADLRHEDRFLVQDIAKNRCRRASWECDLDRYCEFRPENGVPNASRRS